MYDLAYLIRVMKLYIDYPFTRRLSGFDVNVSYEIMMFDR